MTIDKTIRKEHHEGIIELSEWNYQFAEYMAANNYFVAKRGRKTYFSQQPMTYDKSEYEQLLQYMRIKTKPR